MYSPTSLFCLLNQTPDLMATHCKSICGHKKDPYHYSPKDTYPHEEHICLIKNDNCLCPHITSVMYNDSDITSVLTTSESHGFSHIHGENVPNDYVQVLESNCPVSLLSITN